MKKFDPKDYGNTEIDFLFVDENVPKGQNYVVISCVEPVRDLFAEYENFRWGLFMKKVGAKLLFLDNIETLKKIAGYGEFNGKKIDVTELEKKMKLRGGRIGYNRITNDQKKPELIKENEKKLIEENEKKLIEENDKKLIEENDKKLIEEKKPELIEEKKPELIEEKKPKLIEENDKKLIEEKKPELIEEKKKNNAVPEQMSLSDKRSHLMEDIAGISYDMDEMYEEYKTFCNTNALIMPKLWKNYCEMRYGQELYPYRMYMIHGVSSTTKGAQKIAEKVKSSDLHAGNLYIHKPGYWIKFAALPNEMKEKKVLDKKMNELMHGAVMHEASMQKYYDSRSDIFLRESLANGMETKKIPGKDVLNLSEEEFNKKINVELFKNLPIKKIEAEEKESLIDKIKDVDEKIGEYSVTPKMKQNQEEESINKFVEKMANVNNST